MKALVLATVLAGSTVSAQQSDFRQIAASLAGDVTASGKRTLAVVDFTDLRGTPSELGRFLAEEFAVAITRVPQKGFDVIDRTHLAALLKEHKLSTTGLIDPSTAQKLGLIAGAQALVTGSLTPFSESIRVTVKVLATDTARIIAADSIDLPKTKTLADLMGGRTQSEATMTEDRPVLRRASPNETQQLEVKSSVPRSQRVNRQPVVVQQFSFELVSCRQFANTATCRLRITNLGRDRELRLNCHPSDAFTTKAFDNFGNQSAPAGCSIANKQQGTDPTHEIVAGIGVDAVITFANINPASTSLSLLRVQGGLSGEGPLQVEFRGIALDK